MTASNSIFIDNVDDYSEREDEAKKKTVAATLRRFKEWQAKQDKKKAERRIMDEISNG